MDSPEARATEALVQKAIGKTSTSGSDRKTAWKEVKQRAADGDEIAFECVEKVANGEWSTSGSHRQNATNFLKELK